jgi:hypothetical protein
MADLVPCPNRACNALFSRHSLRGATRFTCPRCGKTFQVRSAPSTSKEAGAAKQPVSRRARGSGDDGAAPAVHGTVQVVPADDPQTPGASPPGSTSQAPAVPPKSAAKVVATAAPAAAPPAAPVQPAAASSELLFVPESEPGAIIVTRRRRRQNAAGLIGGLLAIGAFAGAAVWGFWWYTANSLKAEVEQAERASNSSYVLLAPGQGWKKDAELQMRMQVGRAARRSLPAATMAFFAHDYKTRLPGEGEMIDAALEKLRGQFKRLEWERKSGEYRLGGQVALALEFDATDADEVDVRGTVYLLAYRGFGYWLFLWAPASEKDLAAAETERIRASLGLNAAFREGWQERAPDTEIVAIRDGGVSLAYVKSVWEAEDKTGYDPKAACVLKGTFPMDGSGKQRDRHAGKVATVQLLVLDAPEKHSVAAAARDYVLEAAKDPDRGNYPQTTLAPIKDKSGEEQDHDADLGQLHGRLTKLRMTNTEDRERFLVLGAVPGVGDRPVVIWCECDWSVRDYWDNEFGVLLGSMRPTKTRDTANEKPASPDEKE